MECYTGPIVIAALFTIIVSSHVTLKTVYPQEILLSRVLMVAILSGIYTVLMIVLFVAIHSLERFL